MSDVITPTRVRMSPAQAAEYIGYTLKTLYKKTCLREVPFHKRPGGQTAPIYFFQDELDAYLNGGYQKTNAELQTEAEDLHNKNRFRSGGNKK